MRSALREEAQAASPSSEQIQEPLFPRLKPGPGLPACEVAANQRARLCVAMVELIALRGYGKVTVRELARLAGVSTKTFYDCFANLDECFVVTHREIVRSVLGAAATIGEPDDAARLRHRIRALFAGLGADPKAAQLVLSESLVAGPRVIDWGLEMKGLERLISEEFAAVDYPVLLRPVLARGIASAALRVVRTRVPDRRTELAGAADRFADWALALRDKRFVRISGFSVAELGAVARSRPEGGKGDERRLLLAAVARLSIRDGYRGLTVPVIRREAGLSRRCFDEHFTGVEDCFLAAVEGQLVSAAERADREAARAGSWERGLVRAAAEIATTVARDPKIARFAMVDVLAAGRPGLELRERVITAWAKRLRKSGPARFRNVDLLAEASVAAAWGIVEAHVTAGRGDRILAEIPALAFVVLAPAIGPERAVRAISAELGQVRRRRVIKHSAEVP